MFRYDTIGYESGTACGVNRLREVKAGKDKKKVFDEEEAEEGK